MSLLQPPTPVTGAICARCGRAMLAGVMINGRQVHTQCATTRGGDAIGKPLDSPPFVAGESDGKTAGS